MKKTINKLNITNSRTSHSINCIKWWESVKTKDRIMNKLFKRDHHYCKNNQPSQYLNPIRSIIKITNPSLLPQITRNRFQFRIKWWRNILHHQISLNKNYSRGLLITSQLHTLFIFKKYCYSYIEFVNCKCFSYWPYFLFQRV